MFEIVFEKALTSNSTGWDGQTRVQVIPASVVGAAQKIRLTLTGASTKPLGVLSMYVGERGADAYDFFSTPVQVKVGGNGAFDVPQNGSVVTDNIEINFSGTKDLVIAASYTTDTSKNDLRVLFGGGTGCSYFWKVGVNEASLVNKTSYQSAGNNPNALGMISKIEVERPEEEELEENPSGVYGTPAGIDARLIDKLYAPTYNINNPRNFQRIAHLAIPNCQSGDVITAFSSWAFTLDFNVTTEVCSGLILTPAVSGTAGIEDVVGNQFALSLGEQPTNGVFVSRFPGRNLNIDIHHDFHNHSGVITVPEGMSGTLYLAIIAYADAGSSSRYITVEPHSCYIQAKVDKAN